ncbi:MAG: lytic murein transglycosylase [Aeromicrobium sp.]
MNRSSVVPVVFLLIAVVVVVGLVTVRSGDVDDPLVDAPPAAATLASTEIRAASRATGIPRRALTAYVAAAQRVEQDDPACRIGWNTLAGIGSSESSHGVFGGAELGADGVATPLIIGVPLDGTAGNRAITDTDGGTLDEDTTWDRAVGPLQFIPTTWQQWGADGDEDGVRNPHDIDDAALAAARYLCDAGDDLSASDGWSRAVLTYNQSGSYARTVARTATEYAQAF